ncbi:DUF2326 domain-containing protein [Labilibaculum euxinus]|uniref:DUF2326 domain-containing protein n=1 Tax=Labilibaculum euxinus TaxID=2686357 RepID=A0A7M4D433_9BACT|nr:DUF2326 domain-containing protein [Labilibaculum euxinus]MUP37412.1 DUF2326 domain-containing protein [Labilibaculum euxinus]MVB06617.1 DUF2326 domain-containing protein [Labilibaculum euxinus]
MFLKSLTISKGTSIIRDIEFRKGINLIVDRSEGKITGNSVGKTTVLKLIDFCFGAKAKNIWEDPENKKEIYALVKDYLIDNEVLISLCLTENLDDENASEIIIERNFLSAKSKVIRKVNGKQLLDDEFVPHLTGLLFPEHVTDKPTLRQIISHNIRYKDLSISNTLKTLDGYTSDAVYETLHLFLLGCEFKQGNSKQELLEQIRQEDTFRKRLEKVQTKSAYETTLSLIESEIEELNIKKSSLNLNENFETDLNSLNQLKYGINKLSSEISKLNIRKELINETLIELEASTSGIDTEQLNQIYQQATNVLGKLQKSFEDMVNYHNNMISEKTKFISNELPSIESKIKKQNRELKNLLKKEAELSLVISKSDSFEELEILIGELNEKYRLKGEYENIIQQLNEVESNIKSYNKTLNSIDEELFSDDFELTVKTQLNKFNKHFTSVSELLYNEKYALKYDKIKNKKGQRLYKFSAFNTNFSSGKKQGEISCFDIAYTFFADDENIPCMHFILNDKKELMHDNQLVKIAELVNESEIQFVASILKDKLPDELNKEEYFIVELSEDNKLFQIEN